MPNAFIDYLSMTIISVTFHQNMFFKSYMR
jgi:hypothetical protein